METTTYKYLGNKYVYDNGKWARQNTYHPSVTYEVTNKTDIDRLNAMYPGVLLIKQSEEIVPAITVTPTLADPTAAYADGAMQARGFVKNASSNWEKDGVEYDNNGQPIKKAVVVTRPSAQAQGLFSGDLRSYQNRKNWVAEHKDYLKERGANINWDNYSGTAEQNIALKRLLDDFDEWNAAKQKAVAPSMSQEEKFIKDGYASGRPWQDAELQNMEGSSALYLNQDDYLRWQGLQFGLRQARPYVTPAKPVLNPNAPRKDIYNPTIAVAPYALVNPIVAAKKIGGKINYQKIFK